MCLSMNLFQFILWEVILAFESVGFVFCTGFEKVIFIISLNSLLSLSFLLLWSPLIQAYFLQALDNVFFFFCGGGGGNLFYFLFRLRKFNSSSLLLWYLLLLTIFSNVYYETPSPTFLFISHSSKEVYQIRSGCVQVQLPTGPSSHLAKSDERWLRLPWDGSSGQLFPGESEAWIHTALLLPKSRYKIAQMSYCSGWREAQPPSSTPWPMRGRCHLDKERGAPPASTGTGQEGSEILMPASSSCSIGRKSRRSARYSALLKLW